MLVLILSGWEIKIKEGVFEGEYYINEYHILDIHLCQNNNSVLHSRKSGIENSVLAS